MKRCKSRGRESWKGEKKKWENEGQEESGNELEEIKGRWNGRGTEKQRERRRGRSR